MELEIWSKASFGNIKGQHLPFRARFYSWPPLLKGRSKSAAETISTGRGAWRFWEHGGGKQSRPETVISEVINWGAGATGRIISVSPGSVITELFAKWRVMEQTVCQWSQQSSQTKWHSYRIQVRASRELSSWRQPLTLRGNLTHFWKALTKKESTGLWNYADRRLPIKPGDRRFGPMKTCQAMEILLLLMVMEKEMKRKKKTAMTIHFPYEKMEPEKDKPTYSGSRT